MAVATIHRLEQLFRRAAGLDLDKSDFDRLEDFVRPKFEDLVVRGEANAKANGRDVVQPWDLPITKGLQETIHRFRLINAELRLTDYLAGLIRLPPTIWRSATRRRNASLKSPERCASPSRRRSGSPTRISRTRRPRTGSGRIGCSACCSSGRYPGCVRNRPSSSWCHATKGPASPRTSARGSSRHS